MSSGKTLISPDLKIDHLIRVDKPTISWPSPPKAYAVMWRNIAKLASSRKPTRISLDSNSFSRTCFHGCSRSSIFPEKVNFRPFELDSCFSGGLYELGFGRTGQWLPPENIVGRPSLGCLRSQASVHCLSPKSYASVAEAIPVSSTDAEEDISNAPAEHEVHELLEEMRKEEKRKAVYRKRRRWRIEKGMSAGKYERLRRRQVKIETEAWELAVKEYRELLMDMCKQKLAQICHT